MIDQKQRSKDVDAVYEFKNKGINEQIGLVSANTPLTTRGVQYAINQKKSFSAK
jgi:hypothetical protein